MFKIIQKNFNIHFFLLTVSLTLFFFPLLRLKVSSNLPSEIGLSHLMFGSFLLGIFVFIVISALNLSINKFFNNSNIVTIFFCSVCFYFLIKLNFMLWNYGPVNGVTPDWKSFTLHGLLDLFLVFFVPMSVFFLQKMLFEKLLKITIFLLCTQLLSLVPLALNHKYNIIQNTRLFSNVSEIKSNKKTYSGNHNIILIVLDTFQADFFLQIIENRDKSYVTKFNGFEFFPDTISKFPITFLSLTSIFSGVDYDNTMPFPQYMHEAYLSKSSLMKNFKDLGHYVDIERWGNATPVPSYLLPLITSNYVEDVGVNFNAVLNNELFIFYQVLPQFLKEIYFNFFSDAFLADDNSMDPNISFIKNTTQDEIVKVNDPVFRIIHLKGPHIPLKKFKNYDFDYVSAALNNEKIYSEVKTTRANYAAVAEQSLNSVTRYLDKLKSAGIYDNSTIFIFGDHGAGNQGQYFINSRFGVDQGLIELDNMKSSALPLLLIKPAGSLGDLKINERPTSLGDINCTILSNFTNNFQRNCNDLLKKNHNKNVESVRLFYNNVTQKYIDTEGYAGPLAKYYIKGPAWLEESWYNFGERFLPFGKKGNTSLYELGSKITFGFDGNAINFGADNIRVNKGESFSWSTSKSVSFKIQFDNSKYLSGLSPSEALFLEVFLDPFVLPARLDQQKIIVFVNDEKVDTWHASTRGKFRAVIPSNLTKTGLLRIRFEFPDASSPAALGLNEDESVFGAQFISMVIDSLDYQLGDEVQFGISGNAQKFQSSGFGSPQNGMTWSIGKSSNLIFSIAPGRSINLMMEATLVPFVSPAKLDQQKIIVFVNDEKVDTWHASSFGKFSAVIPSNLTKTGLLRIRFEFPDASSPAALGLNEDESVFGAQFISMFISVPPKN